jgi:preprotein translocase subunit SecE
VKNTGLYITIAIIAVVFAVLWYKGYLVKIRQYIEETKEELRKCTWPTWEELKGNTTVVMITMALLGVFTVVVDFVLAKVINLLHS